MYIETQRLIIRPFTIADADEVYEYCKASSVGRNAGWTPHESLEESTQILSEWISEGFRHAIELKSLGKVIGHIAVDPDSEEEREDTRELGCALNEEYQRRGIMTEAIHAVLEHLFSSGIEYVWACCFKSNIPSKGMIEKCGFELEQEGTYYSESLDEEFDSYEYRMSRQQWNAMNKS